MTAKNSFTRQVPASSEVGGILLVDYLSFAVVCVCLRLCASVCVFVFVCECVWLWLCMSECVQCGECGCGTRVFDGVGTVCVRVFISVRV